MAEVLYNKTILRLACSIPHLGRLEKVDGTAERRSKLCGSRVTVDVLLDSQGRISRLAQDVHACALGQASASIMGHYALGRDRRELASAREGLARFLTCEAQTPGEPAELDVFRAARPFGARHAAILLPFDAVLAAVDAALEPRGAE